jgi:phosphatidylserine/phosphatidylglycerophosphate/cardiolipin synthase-like enzyme
MNEAASDKAMYHPSSLANRISATLFPGTSAQLARQANVDKITVSTARSSLVQVLESNVRREKVHIQKALPIAIGGSQMRCFVTTPYFLPPKRIMMAMIDAAKRGVDVRIITAGRTDVALAKFAGRHLYGLFLKYGIKIYEMKKQGKIDSYLSFLFSSFFSNFSFFQRCTPNSV